MTFESSRYTYDFQVLIPETAPSTTHQKHGSIQYNVRVRYYIPWATDYAFLEVFTVSCPINLNLNPNLRMPAEKYKTKTFGCCCFASDRLEFTVKLPKTGFAIGEDLNIMAEINNPTSTTKYFVRSFNPRVSHEK